MTSDLPTTSYAILGLLALRSWTGYELAQQGRRSMAFMWPKAESVIYEEPRRLVTLGLARATKEETEHARRQLHLAVIHSLNTRRAIGLTLLSSSRTPVVTVTGWTPGTGGMHDRN